MRKDQPDDDGSSARRRGKLPLTPSPGNANLIAAITKPTGAPNPSPDAVRQIDFQEFAVWGATMKKLGMSLLATVSLVSLAYAADLPTTKPAPVPKPNCFASFWTWLNSSVDECPLSYAGVTLYSTIDVGYDYMTHGSSFNPSNPDGVPYGISKYSQGRGFHLAPNQLSTSNVGVKINEPIAYGWSLVGVAEFGFNPYSGMLANGPRSLTDNNVNPLPNQSMNGDSSRAGAWRSAQMYVGLSNKTYGTLDFG